MKKLITKIDHKAEEFILKMDAERDQKIRSQEISTSVKKNDLELQKSKSESDKAKLELENKISKENVIPDLNSQIQKFETTKSICLYVALCLQIALT